jgi:hypothetical protein
VLFWGAPVGKDALVWNAHRVYGPRRLPLMFRNFEILEWFGFTHDSIKDSQLGAWHYQPVIVLRKKREQPGSPKIVLDKNQMSHWSGNCYAVEFPEYYMPFDWEGGSERSNLTLYENESRLLESHALHEDIIRVGLGKYSHWYNTLYFSSSDNSDPCTNQNVYRIDFARGSICFTSEG